MFSTLHAIVCVVDAKEKTMNFNDREIHGYYSAPDEIFTEIYDLSESWEDFEIRQAFEDGDIDRANQLLSLKGSNDFM